MIFLDMDGVLVDFDGEFERNHGILPYKLPRQELWQIVLDTKDYWVNLPKLKDADDLMAKFKISGVPITEEYSKSKEFYEKLNSDNVWV